MSVWEAHDFKPGGKKKGKKGKGKKKKWTDNNNIYLLVNFE